MIRNFIWEGNESGGGRDWFSLPPPFSFRLYGRSWRKRMPAWNVHAFLMKVAMVGDTFDIEFSNTR